MSVSEAQLQELLAKQAITEVTHRYARAIDRLDEALLRSVFHPGSVHSHFYEGPSSDPSIPSSADSPGDFVAFAFGVLSAYSRTHHQLGNTLISFDEPQLARSETYFTAFHRMRPRGDPLAAEAAYDTEMDYFVGGRYIDRFECREGVWAIAKRTGMTDWIRLEAPTSQGFGDIRASTLGRRAPDDLIYQPDSV